MLEVLNQIEAEVLEERDLQRGQMEKQWGQLLLDRVESGRALGKLEIASIDHSHKLIHFIPPREDFAFLKEQQRVRISQDSPAGHHFGGIFYGLTEQGLTVRCTACDQLDFEQIQGWTIDEDFVDVSDFYLRGLKQLAESAHGRETVFPILFEEQAATIDAETFDDTYNALDESESPLNDSQKDAVATALAASPMHLIQGPPGTGKTQTLARLVERLFIEGHRVLVTGFTHRSIDNALSKIQDVLNGQCPVVKVGAQVSNEAQNFPRYDTLEESGLSDCQGPHVIGATPFALYTKRLNAAHFDSAVVDETSQMTLPAAILVMMKSDRWFFFGDDKQLPPVSQVHRDDPSRASIFGRLKQQTEFSTLSTTYRMNQELTEWPSEMFYHGELESRFPDNALALKAQPMGYRATLDPENSLIGMQLTCEASRSCNDSEADLCAAIIEEILNCGIEPEQIGVVTPFRAQASRVRTLLRNVIAPPHRHLERSIIVDTVDRFQGQEREVMLYSFTASEPSFIRKIHAFLLNPARMNVALTRARTKVILLCSSGLRDYLESHAASDELADLALNLLRQTSQVSTITEHHGKTFP